MVNNYWKRTIIRFSCVITTTTSTRLIRLEDDFRQGFPVVNRDLVIDNGKAIERFPRARSIQPKFRPVRPGKEDHLKRWTCFFETFPVGPNRSIEFWTEISGNFGWMDRAPSLRVSSQNYLVITSTRSVKKLELACKKWPCLCLTSPQKN